MVVPFFALIARDIALAWRAGGAAGLTLGFFLVALSLYPFALGPSPDVLQKTAPGLIWVTALFTCLLGLDRIFQADYDDGTLAQLMLSRLTPGSLVLAKIIAHWVGVMLPLLLLAPLMAVSFGMPGDMIVRLLVALAVGTPSLSLFGALAAALTVSVRRGGVLITLILLPFFIPVLIFGVAAVGGDTVAVRGSDALALLAAVTLFALAISPLATSLSIKLALE